jgi:hypothetical protein
MRRAYQAAHARVRALAAAHGDGKLLNWLRSGLPAGVSHGQPGDKSRHRQPR